MTRRAAVAEIAARAAITIAVLLALVAYRTLEGITK